MKGIWILEMRKYIEEIIDRLNRKGMNITVYDTNPGKKYSF